MLELEMAAVAIHSDFLKGNARFTAFNRRILRWSMVGLLTASLSQRDWRATRMDLSLFARLCLCRNPYLERGRTRTEKARDMLSSDDPPVVRNFEGLTSTGLAAHTAPTCRKGSSVQDFPPMRQAPRDRSGCNLGRPIG